MNYYNEYDIKTAAWLQELIYDGQIPDGYVDTRSISDVRPSDLAGFTQCHFFAGIGIWSYALRRAGWADDRPVWTGSCPCQPFSNAGKGDGFADERHLWPHFLHLIRVCRPSIVLGEQVASKDGLAWLDLVATDLEGENYAVGATDLCAAGVGAPHIRQRLYWVADPNYRGEQPLLRARPHDSVEDLRSGTSNRLGRPVAGGDRRELGRLADTERDRGGSEGDAPGDGQPQAYGSSDRVGGRGGASGRLADSERAERPDGQPRVGVEHDAAGRVEGAAAAAGLCGDHRPGPTNGHWAPADWLACRDGKWRPVEPGTFPLADGAPARVVQLRGYGNGLVAPAAQAFIEAVMQC